MRGGGGHNHSRRFWMLGSFLKFYWFQTVFYATFKGLNFIKAAKYSIGYNISHFMLFTLLKFWRDRCKENKISFEYLGKISVGNKWNCYWLKQYLLKYYSAKLVQPPVEVFTLYCQQLSFYFIYIESTLYSREKYEPHRIKVYAIQLLSSYTSLHTIQ